MSLAPHLAVVPPLAAGVTILGDVHVAKVLADAAGAVEPDLQMLVVILISFFVSTGSRVDAAKRCCEIFRRRRHAMS